MDKLKETFSDPAKIEAFLKDAWSKIDTKGEGSVTYEEYLTKANALAKSLGVPEEKPPTEEELAKAKKVADPNGTGKINFEGFKALVLAMAEEAKKTGK